MQSLHLIDPGLLSSVKDFAAELEKITLTHRIQTVLGSIRPETLGTTLTHEHLLYEVNNKEFEVPLPEHVPRDSYYSLAGYGLVRQYPYSDKSNLNMNNYWIHHAVREELREFKRYGGTSIVETSTYGVRAKQHPTFLRNLSKETGVNIVACTGFSLEAFLSSSIDSFKPEDMDRAFVTDILEGMHGTDIKCGLISVCCTWPVTDFQKLVLRTAGNVQGSLRCPVTIMSGCNPEAPSEIMRIFQEAGGHANQTVMSHLDWTMLSDEELFEIARTGCYCGFDLLGHENSYYQLDESADILTDAESITKMHTLIKEGFLEHVVMSHDIHTKHRLREFGGHGFSHILLIVLPKMLKRGITLEMTDQILIYNPKRWLQFEQ